MVPSSRADDGLVRGSASCRPGRYTVGSGASSGAGTEPAASAARRRPRPRRRRSAMNATSTTITRGSAKPRPSPPLRDVPVPGARPEPASTRAAGTTPGAASALAAAAPGAASPGAARSSARPLGGAPARAPTPASLRRSVVANAPLGAGSPSFRPSTAAITSAAPPKDVLETAPTGMPSLCAGGAPVADPTVATVAGVAGLVGVAGVADAVAATSGVQSIAPSRSRRPVRLAAPVDRSGAGARITSGL
jgi:hypothetical protein